MSEDRQVALISGINVGRAKRVAMSELRALVEGLGYRNVRTLLNSGNVVSLPLRASHRMRLLLASRKRWPGSSAPRRG